MTDITLTGQSGNKHTFQCFAHGGTWNAVPGLYVFVYQDWAGVWRVVYIGETGDYSARLNNHDRWDEAAKTYGCTHVLAMVCGGDAVRKEIERDLIASYNPPMNTHHLGFGALNLESLGLLNKR